MSASIAAGEPRTDYEVSCHGPEASGSVIRDILSRIGDKWTLLVVVTLRDGRLRFTELQQHIPGISQRMLTLTLRQLERDGLVERTVHAEVPPRVEYELTPVGATLIEPAAAFAGWAIANQELIESSRAGYDARRAN